MSSTIDTTIQRRRIFVQGIVQGVGFRPFIYGQALRWNLAGFVLNDSQGVTIEIEGTPEALDSFQKSLNEQAPPLSRIDSIVTEPLPPRHEHTFTITHSQKGNERNTLISPDTATCDDCLHELFDPTDRRYHYPFTNCTNCGPRFTIVQDVPYDREKTTMRVFPMCSDCQTEYTNQLNRRFHAQPNACPTCGPQVSLSIWHPVARAKFMTPASPVDSPAETETVVGAAFLTPASPTDSLARDGIASETGVINVAPTEDPISAAAQSLVSGAILAIKGLGGYHLACDALNERAVQQLRQRKHREAKPFALMVPDLETAQQLCQLSDAESTLLQSRRRPIVLLHQRPSCQLAADVAPNCDTLGIMLPYTPLHHLLLCAFASAINPGRPAVLVLTSGNVSDEPIAYRDDDARQRLHGIADGVLTHNRDIHMRCDDSVLRIAANGEQLFRRSRGYAPEPILLAKDLPIPILACGGHLKNTFCLGKGRQAFVSHHIGDLGNLETLTSFRTGIEHFQRLFDIYPQAIAYDLHPEYLATKYALDSDIPQKIATQHHHAHIASVLAEHDLHGPVIGIAADGTGYGTDGAVWGCEIMTANLIDFERLAHLAYVPLPGGEQAVRQPWRVAAVYLAHTYGSDFLQLDIPFVRQLNRTKWYSLSQMIAKGINSPQTSSLGRLFDAVAALLNLRNDVIYEGQAAIELEVLAYTATRDEDSSTSYPFTINTQTPGSPAQLDVTPIIRAIVHDIQHGVPAQQIAHRFHTSIAELLTTTCLAIRAQTGLNIVALSGGVFQNRLLLEQLLKRLHTMEFQVYINRRVPPNDGGLSLGQLAIVAARLAKRAS